MNPNSVYTLNSTGTVALFRMDNEFNYMTCAAIARDISLLAVKPKVQTLVLQINSYGGETAQLARIGAAIEQFRRYGRAHKSQRQVWAITTSVACSCGWVLLMMADRSFMERWSLVMAHDVSVTAQEKRESTRLAECSAYVLQKTNADLYENAEHYTSRRIHLLPGTRALKIGTKGWLHRYIHNPWDGHDVSAARTFHDHHHLSELWINSTSDDRKLRDDLGILLLNDYDQWYHHADDANAEKDPNALIPWTWVSEFNAVWEDVMQASSASKNHVGSTSGSFTVGRR